MNPASPVQTQHPTAPAWPSSAAPCRVLLLPGWQDSGPGHWQSLWQAAHGFERVQQADWHWPRQGDWMAQLDEAVLASPLTPTVLAAHSLGCLLVAAWAAHSQHTACVRGALLVAPPDTTHASTPPQLANWRRVARQRLPFAAHVVFSSDDPFCAPSQALAMAADWGARTTALGPAGHINASSGLGNWPQGLAWLQQLATPQA
jgi:uncharacterized protein